MREKLPHIVNRESWLKVGVVVLFSCLAVYKIVTATNTIGLTGFSFSEFLALILSLFAIAMSVAFYFKATDTSNQFYDNTYKFTKEISEILGRIEAGFGERLRHLDEGYSGLSARFDRMPIDTAKAQEAFEKEKEIVAQKEKEREKLIDDLATRAKLQENEKKKLFADLKEREVALQEARRELMFLRHRAEGAEEESEPLPTEMSHGMIGYMRNVVIPELGGVADIAHLSMEAITRRFNSMMGQFEPPFIDDCIKLRMATPKGLLIHGAKILRRIAREEMMKKKG
ncbi:MAG: hypothetical protein A2167_00695 [Planctomycetes bacterium RBG_13_46_10]|nr:MAG: hypothetical protein A2167_00695 [Planctomycetes bacterium RBG_13_46_10]